MMVVGQDTLIVGVSYLTPTSKFIVHISGSRGCTQRALAARFILVRAGRPYFQSLVACTIDTIDDQTCNRGYK
jgi:hypothetical protein